MPSRSPISAKSAAGTAPVEIEVGPSDGGLRLDRFLADRLADLSRSRLQALIKSGAVRGSGGTLLDPGQRVKPGELVVVDTPPPAPAGPEPESIPLAIVYEDEHLVVIDKPAGLVVHPAAGHATGTLVNALIAHCGESLSGIGGVKRPGIVHRLDKDTTGLLVVAKTDLAHRGLAEQFAAHGTDGRMTRRYLAVAWGALPTRQGRIDAALARSTSNRTRIAVTRAAAGRHAVTHYEVRQSILGADGRPLASVVECRLETGRTHQIRVHLAHIGNPLMGDATYGSHFSASVRRLSERSRVALDALGRQALHAAHLGFEHPKTGKSMAFDSPAPPELASLIKALSKEQLTAKSQRPRR